MPPSTTTSPLPSYSPVPSDADDDPTSPLTPPSATFEPPPLPVTRLLPLLLFSLPNGLLLCTYFLLTLPLESARINADLKSVYLAMFIAISGATQLMCPAVGWWSDRCTLERGERLNGSMEGIERSEREGQSKHALFSVCLCVCVFTVSKRRARAHFLTPETLQNTHTHTRAPPTRPAHPLHATWRYLRHPLPPNPILCLPSLPLAFIHLRLHDKHA